MIGETVTVTREGTPGETDALGFPVLGEPTTFDFVTLCPCAPLYASETPTQSGDSIVSGYKIIGPPDLSLLSTDMLTIRGVSGWQVEGVPGRWDRPSTGEAWSTEFVVRKAS